MKKVARKAPSSINNRIYSSSMKRTNVSPYMNSQEKVLGLPSKVQISYGTLFQKQFDVTKSQVKDQCGSHQGVYHH